ncbi:MAG: ABC transporter permease [Acidimicrobiia bacterium]|nr:ABC transporter permease [Acidimicrobiia bacterium]
MTKLTARNLRAHKRRLISTFVAIVLGVSFLGGTLVLGDTMKKTFDDLFADANSGTDVVVRSSAAVDVGGDTTRGPLDQSIVSKVAAVDGVAKAEPYVEGFGQLVGRDGDPIGGAGPPTVAAGWLTDGRMNPYDLSQGRLPRAANEVVIDRGAAKDGHFAIGDTVRLQTPEPHQVKVVGISTFGKTDSAGGMTYTAFTFNAAQDLLLSKGKISEIRVRGVPGVSQGELAHRIDEVLPSGAQTITGKALTKEQSDDIGSQFLDMLRTSLVVFAGVALLVATFSISNTFSIIVAQRSRESALLRAIGASRRQVLLATMGETLAIGTLASIVGVAVGLGMAAGLKAGFSALGLAVPASGLVVSTSAIVAPLIVGVLVTFVAGFLPAIRGSRIPPLAAMREVALDRTGTSAVRAAIGAVVALGGAALVLVGVAGSGNGALSIAGLGAVMVIVGAVVFGPVAAGPVARILGSVPARLRGMPGHLARENAVRNPRRTSGTAASLMVGVAVVTVFTVMGASIKASVNQSVDRSFGGDLVVKPSGFGEAGISPTLTRQIGALPQVETSAGLGFAPMKVGATSDFMAVADPAQLDRVYDMGVSQGDFAHMDAHGLAVSNSYAKDHSLKLGTTVPVTFVDGAKDRLRVEAVYDEDQGFGDALVSKATWLPHAEKDTDQFILIGLRHGVSIDDGRAAVQKLTKPYAGIDVQDRDEYVASVAQGVDQFLVLVYLLLFLAIVIAVIGIANTLALSVHERTHELGLLRAVGETRPQVRSMVRWESVIIAVFGALGGLGVGVFLGWALVSAASSGDLAVFAVPPVRLAVIVGIAWLAAIWAARRPAKRAARLDVLKAISTD